MTTGEDMMNVIEQKYWVPVFKDPRRYDVLVTDEQLAVATLWAKRTAQRPDKPRSLRGVFPGTSGICNQRRAIARKLIEKGILRRDGAGAYVMSNEARTHFEYWEGR